MTELDCSNVETALLSLLPILDRPLDDLKNTLANFKGEASTEEEKNKYTFGDRLLLKVAGGLREHLPFADSVVWFHATRVPPNTDYKDGLLPTYEARPRIRQILRKIALDKGICTAVEWATLEAKADQASNTIGKTQPSPRTGEDAGPHGFLPRDYIIAQMPSYIKCPEEVNEFCSRVEGDRGEQLLREYKDQTRSAIVRFRSRTRVDCAVATAIQYVHWKLIGGQLSLSDCPSCGWCGRGISVPKSDILGIEWIDVPLPS